MSWRISSIAGQPVYVGVMRTVTASPSTSTERITPSSSRVSTGISGSTTAVTTSRAGLRGGAGEVTRPC